jgi:hypothetical protein
MMKPKRIALTVPAELDGILERLSDLQEKPKTTVILDLLMEMQPQLTAFAEALEAAKAGKNPYTILNDMLGVALQELGSELQAAGTAKDQK